MAGHGPAPKPADRRARRNRPDQALKVIPAEPTAQPPLPTFYVTDAAGNRRRFSWPTHTRAWWRMWRDSPLSAEFTDTDWSELLDTALLHARFWTGDHRVAGELRLRVAKFGATPEDRARLRITFAAADEADGKRSLAGETPAASGRVRQSRYAGLKSVGGQGAVAGT